MTKIDLDAYFLLDRLLSRPREWTAASERSGRWHDRAALLAGSEFFRTVKIAISQRHRICAIVIYDVGLLMQKAVAILAKPIKSIDVSRDARALDDQLEGIRCK